MSLLFQLLKIINANTCFTCESPPIFLKIQINIITKSDSHVNIVTHIFINVNSYFKFLSKNSRNSLGDIENKSTSVNPSRTASPKISSIE